MRAEKKKHPQGVEQFADSTDTQANAPIQGNYSTRYGTPYERICAEISWWCSKCQNKCSGNECLAYRIDRIITERDMEIRSINIDELFERGDEGQMTLFTE